MLNIGQLNRRITIESMVTAKSPTGDMKSSWQAGATIWAEVIQQSANEFLTGYGEAEAGNIVFRIRYRPGITTKDRVKFNGTAYNLKEIREIGNREALELRGEAEK